MPFTPGIRHEDHRRQLILHNTTPVSCECVTCGAPLMRPATKVRFAKCELCKKEAKRELDAAQYRKNKAARMRSQW